MGVETSLAILNSVAAVGQFATGQRMKEKGEAAAEAAAASAVSKIEQGVTNQYAGLSVADEAYDIAEDQTQQAVTQAVEASREAGAEGVIGGVGKIVDSASEAGLKTAAAKAKDIQGLEEKKAAEQARIDQMKYQGLLDMDMMRLQGAQAAAAEGAEMKRAAIGNAFSGLSDLSQLYASQQPLYSQDKNNTES